MYGLRRAKQCRELRILKNNKILENFKIQRTEKKANNNPTLKITKNCLCINFTFQMHSWCKVHSVLQTQNRRTVLGDFKEPDQITYASLALNKLNKKIINQPRSDKNKYNCFVLFLCLL